MHNVSISIDDYQAQKVGIEIFKRYKDVPSGGDVPFMLKENDIAHSELF